MGHYSDLSFDNGQYIQQYAGAPLEELQKTSDVLSTRHYGNLAKLSQLQQLIATHEAEATPGAKPYIREQGQAVEQALSELAQSGAENSTSRVIGMANHYMTNQGAMNILARSKEYQEKLKDISDIKKAGHTPIYDQKALDEIRDSPYIDTKTGKPFEHWMSPVTTSPEVYINPAPEMEELLKYITPEQRQSLLEPLVNTTKKAQIQQSLTSALQSGLSQDEIPVFLHSKVVQYLEPGKLERIANMLFDNYKKSPSYQQQVKFAGKGNMSTANDEELKQQLVNLALSKEFTHIGEQFQHNPASILKDGPGGGFTPFGGKVLDPAVINDKIRPRDPNALSVGKQNLNEEGVNPGRVGEALSKETPEQKIEKAKVQKDYYDTVQAAIENYGIKINTAVQDWGYQLNKPEGDSTSNPIMSGDTYTPEQFKAFADSKQGHELFTKFMDEAYSPELDNAYGSIYPKKVNMEVDDIMKRNAYSLNYYDDNHKKIPALVDGKINPEWEKLVGKVENFSPGERLSPYNLRAGLTGEDAAASGMFSVNSTDKEGNNKHFYISNPAGLKGSEDEVNTNVLYFNLRRHPGVFVPTPDGQEHRLLIGAQKDAAWKLHGPELIKQYGEEAAAQIFSQMSQGPLIETKQADGSLLLGTPYTQGSALAQHGILLTYKKK